MKELADYKVYTKSALMLGLGETLEEVERTLADMREFGVDFITIGQYMRPTKQHLSIKRWVPPAEFDQMAAVARTPVATWSIRLSLIYRGCSSLRPRCTTSSSCLSPSACRS